MTKWTLMSLLITMSAMLCLVLCLSTGDTQAAAPAGDIASAPSVASAPASVMLDGTKPVEAPANLLVSKIPPVYAVRLVPSPPVIDGKLDEPAWSDAPEMAPFRDPQMDSPGPRRATIARLVSCGGDLYVGVRCTLPDVAKEGWAMPGPAPVRDTVTNSGESVLLSLNAGPASADAVSILFHPSGVFTDSRGDDASWNGDIESVGTIDEEGWRLEARISLSSLPGWRPDAPADTITANITRRSKFRTGGWAQASRSETGLLTLAREGLAVEALSMGLLGPQQESGDCVPLVLGVRNLADRPRDGRIVIAMVGQTGRVLRQQTIALSLPAGQAVSRTSPVDCSGASTLRVNIAPDDSSLAAFMAELPLAPVPQRSDCLSSPDLAVAVRSTSNMWLSNEPPPIYLIARSLRGKPVKYQGQLIVRNEAGEGLWQCPVSVDLPAGGSDVQAVQLPPGLVAPGQCRVEWQVRDDQPERLAVSEAVCAPLAYLRSLGEMSPADYLAGAGCITPASAEDLSLVQVKLWRLAEASQRQQRAPKTDLTAEIRRYHTQLAELVELLRTGEPFLAVQRGWFESVVRSPADGSCQPVAVFVPYDYDSHPDRRYPLEVWLHGSGQTHGADRGYPPDLDRHITDRIRMYPLARGKSCGYSGVSGNDVRVAIEAMTSRYRIDADRVHLRGESMGGFGSFEIASQSPDWFATCMPTMGGGYWCDLAQMRNVPTFIHHGLADTLVAPFCSTSTAAKFQAVGGQPQLYLYPGLGHHPLPTETTTPVRMLLDVRRDSEPATVCLAGRMLCFTHAYWAAIERFADPQKRAAATATFVGPNQLSVESTNVKWLRIALPCKWVTPRQPMYITRGHGTQWTQITVDDATAIYLRLDGGQIEAVTQRPAELDDQTAYLGGHAARMFCEGRPVRLVYGTGGGPDAATRAKALAHAIRRFPFTGRDEFWFGGWPVLADTEVSDEVLRTCDLILLGSPADNAVLARMAGELPVKVADAQVSVEANVPMQYPRSDVAFTLLWRNPLAKDRLIWWLGGFTDKEQIAGTVNIGNPDLVLWRRDGSELASAAIAGDWRLEQPLPLTPIRTIWPTYAAFSQARTESLRAQMGADAAMDSDGGPPEDFAGRTLGWLRSQTPDMYLAQMSGKDLRRMYQARHERLAKAEASIAASSPAPAASGSESTSTPASGPTPQTAAEPASQPDPQLVIDCAGGWAGLAGDRIREDQTYRVLLIDGAVWALPDGGVHATLARYITDQQREEAVERFHAAAGPPTN